MQVFIAPFTVVFDNCDSAVFDNVEAAIAAARTFNAGTGGFDNATVFDATDCLAFSTEPYQHA